MVHTHNVDIGSKTQSWVLFVIDQSW